MRMILYIIIIVLVFFAPIEKLDIADLEPVQTIGISVENENVKLQTDTGASGTGASVDAALQEMEESTPGVIYLDTAEYLLLTEEAIAHLDSLRRYLSNTVKVSLWDAKGNIRDAARYLRVENNLQVLKNWEP